MKKQLLENAIEYTDLIFSDPDAAFDLVEEEYRKLNLKILMNLKYFTTLVDNNFFNANIENKCNKIWRI